VSGVPTRKQSRQKASDFFPSRASGRDGEVSAALTLCHLRLGTISQGVCRSSQQVSRRRPRPKGPNTTGWNAAPPSETPSPTTAGGRQSRSEGAGPPATRRGNSNPHSRPGAGRRRRHGLTACASCAAPVNATRHEPRAAQPPPVPVVPRTSCSCSALTPPE
jgi:hypothetical protein